MVYDLRLSFHRQRKRWGITYIATAVRVSDDGRVQHVAIVLDCGMLVKFEYCVRTVPELGTRFGV